MNHLWCLTQDFVGLAFFSDEVPDERKLVMLNALHKPTRKQAVKVLEAKTLAEKIGNMELDDFVMEKCRELFEHSQLIQHS